MVRNSRFNIPKLFGAVRVFFDSTPSDKSAFHHATSFNRPDMIESFCTRCNRFVAASTRLRMLEIVESIHSCPLDVVPVVRKPVPAVHHR